MKRSTRIMSDNTVAKAALAAQRSTGAKRLILASIDPSGLMTIAFAGLSLPPDAITRIGRAILAELRTVKH